MTTSYCSLTGRNNSVAFDVSDVGDAYTEMVDEISNLSLYEVMLGMEVTGFIGSHAAGCTMVRVRNTQTNKVKMLEALDVITEENWRPVEAPFRVEKDDILEAFHVVVPT